MNQRPKVLIADGEKLVTDGLRSIVEREFTVTGTAVDGYELVTAATRLNPDLVLTELALPLLNGIGATRQIKADLRQTRVAMVTSHTEPQYVAEALEAGADAYVLKTEPADQLLHAMRLAITGKQYLTACISGYAATAGHSRRDRTRLTTREREVLQLIAEGKTAKEIGGILCISVKTVEFHKNAIFDALGLRTTAELTRYAIQTGISVGSCSPAAGRQHLLGCEPHKTRATVGP